MLEAGGAEVKDTWIGEDKEAEAEIIVDPDRDADEETTGSEVEVVFGADADANAEADTDTKSDTDGATEAVPDRETDPEMTGTGVTTGAAKSLLVEISWRVTGTGRTVTILIGWAAGEFCAAGAGLRSLAS